MKKTFVILSFILLVFKPVYADVGIEATVNPARVPVGEPVTLTITVNNPPAQVTPPQLPQFANFRSYSQGQSQEITFINGKMTSRNVFSYVLVPTTPGKHVLGQVEVNIGQKTFKTGVLEVEVTESNSLAPSAVQGSSSSVLSGSVGGRQSTTSMPAEYMAGKDIFVKAWVDKEDVYVNEPVYLTYTIYTRVSATFKGFEKEIATTGFWVEEFPPKRAVSKDEQVIDGYRYIVADVRTMALFPTGPGDFTIDPGVMKIDVEVRRAGGGSRMFADDLFGFRTRRQQPSFYTEVVPRLMETHPAKIHVKPLPTAGRPESFKGAVGRYQMSASADRQNVEEGQPITYRVKITGEGNLSTLETPNLPELNDFKSYDSSSSVDLEKNRLVVEGSKTVETVLIPRKKGKFTIPAVEFTYFDPRKEKYVTLKAKEIPVNVSQSSDEVPAPLSLGPTLAPQEVRTLGEDIRHVKKSHAVFRPQKGPLVFTRNFWNLQLMMLGVSLVIVGLKLLTERTAGSAGAIRLRKSTRLSRSRLNKAQGFMKKGLSQEFHECLSEAVYGYFTDKLNLEPGEMGMRIIETRIKDKISPEGYAYMKDVFNKLDYGRFTRVKARTEDMKSLYDSCQTLISKYEGKRL